MKLNLLPKHVSKASSARNSIILASVIFVGCVLGAGFLYMKASSDLEESRQDIARLRGEADRAKATADVADQVIATAQPILLNMNLAEAMLKHNSAYTSLYSDVRRYIPAFYRVTSLSAVPLGENSTSVTIVGILDTYQHYADLMLSLLRMPGVQTVARQGFQNNSPYVPGLSANDQTGKIVKPGEAPIPDNPLDRLAYFESRGSRTGYQNIGGFGSGVSGTRGPLPNYSQVTVNLTIARELRVPNPQETLKQAGSPPATNTPPPAPNNVSNAAPGAGPARTEDDR